jgi:hypothetical protein
MTVIAQIKAKGKIIDCPPIKTVPFSFADDNRHEYLVVVNKEDHGEVVSVKMENATEMGAYRVSSLGSLQNGEVLGSFKQGENFQRLVKNPDFGVAVLQCVYINE